MCELSPLDWWAGDPLELSQELYPGDGQVGEIRPLEIVVNDADLLWGFDGESMATVDCERIAKVPVICLGGMLCSSMVTSTMSFNTSSSCLGIPGIVTIMFCLWLSLGW